MRETGATVIWRCHVGLDGANHYARDAWSLLRGYVLEAHRYVFSRGGFVWEGLPRERITVIHPSIDAFAPKNAGQSSEQSQAILSTAGIVHRQDTSQPTFTRSDGSPGALTAGR